MYKGLIILPPEIVQRFVTADGEGAYDIMIWDMRITVMLVIIIVLLFNAGSKRIFNNKRQ